MEHLKTIGILGGMGPLAGAMFAARLVELTDAKNDQDHFPMVLWSDPAIPDRTMAWFGEGDSPLPALRRGVGLLERAGASVIAIPCNTAHGWHDALSKESSIPILHIVDSAIEELDGLRKGSVGLLGTTATVAMGLYQGRLAAAGWDCLTPSDEEMRNVVMPAIRQVKAGCMSSAGNVLRDAAKRLCDRGAAAVILGCTEIPLVIQEEFVSGVPLINTIDALARAAIKKART